MAIDEFCYSLNTEPFPKKFIIYNYNEDLDLNPMFIWLYRASLRIEIVVKHLGLLFV